MTDLPSVGLFISGLTPNTEYLLAFNVKFYKEGAAKPSFKRLATRQTRTEYFSMLIKLRGLELLD